MHGATVEELRVLSKRSRRAQWAGFLGITVALVMLPVAFLLPAWGAYVAMTVGGAALLGYAYAVGQERGAFRRVFRRIGDDKRASRSVPVQEAAPSVSVRVK